MYAKVFKSMYDGSMYGAGTTIFAVWGWVLINADKEGFVEINPKRLADILGTESAQVSTAIDYLMAEDPHSRTKTLNGRRIEKIGEFKYHIVNYVKYREIRSAEQRREQNKEAKRRSRAKNKESQQHVSTASATVSNGQQRSAMSAQVEVEVNNPPISPQGDENAKPTPKDFVVFYAAYPRHQGKGAAEKAWAKVCKNGPSLRTILEAIEVQKESADWQKDGGKFIPYPATWLNGKRWEDEPSPVAGSCQAVTEAEARAALEGLDP